MPSVDVKSKVILIIVARENLKKSENFLSGKSMTLKKSSWDIILTASFIADKYWFFELNPCGIN